MGDNYDGRADRVLRRLLEEGKVDEAMALVEAVMADDGKDITLAFRASLISQGFEDKAMQVQAAFLFFHTHGYALVIDPRVEGDDCFENKTPELEAAFDNALVWIMRAANIDVYVDEDGDIVPRGPIIADNGEFVEQLVGKFRDEINEQFGDQPKRQGEWW